MDPLEDHTSKDADFVLASCCSRLVQVFVPYSNLSEYYLVGADATFVRINGFGRWRQCHFCSWRTEMNRNTDFLLFGDRLRLVLGSFG